MPIRFTRIKPMAAPNMNTDVYMREDLQNMYNARLQEIKNYHVYSAVEHIKHRVLLAAADGIESHVFRRVGLMLEGHQALHSLNAKGLLANDAIARECLDPIVARLRVIFPDSHISADSESIYIGWGA